MPSGTFKRLSSAKGDILEVVKAEPVMPPGVFINEDPPLHTVHRALVSRAFTPKKMKLLEDKVRLFCSACLDPLVDQIDSTLSSTSGLSCPCGRSACWWVFPTLTNHRFGLRRNTTCGAGRGEPLPVKKDRYFDGNLFAEYVEWREKNPSDDLITDLLHVEFEDINGVSRRLTKEEILIFLAVIAGAGVETTGRLSAGWARCWRSIPTSGGRWRGTAP